MNKPTKTYTEDEILFKITAYCSLAEHCEQEIRLKLSAWGMTEAECQDLLLNYLRENDYLSEYRYCRAFVHDKLLYQGWGRIKIRVGLQLKGLPLADIQTALAEIEETQYQQILQDLLRKKARSLKQGTDFEQIEPEGKARLIRFASSRGFSYPEIKTAWQALELPEIPDEIE